MGFFGGGGVAKSAAQGATSNARDPAVRRTGSNTGTQTRKSSPRPPARKPTQLERTAYNVTGNIARDLNMGLSTFGQSKEKQTATLQAAGYSDDVIKDYQDRTAATQARMASQNMRTEYGRDDSRPAPVSAPAVSAPAPVSAAPTATAPTLTPPEAPAPIGEDASAPAAGTAEEKVVEGAKKRKGRASTIQTAPSGLLTRAKTRRRRSLMGGSEPTGLIS